MKNFLTNLKNIIATKGKQEADIPERKIELREGTAEFELFMAKAELEDRKNLAHGAQHLANLIHYDPTYREWIEMAYEYIKAAGENPEEKLLPQEEKRYVSTEALRAFIWHEEDKLQDAVDLLIEINKSSPDSGYLENWVIKWITPSGKIESLPEQTTTHLYATILNQFGEAYLADFKRLNLVRQWADLLKRIPYESPQWTMIRIGLLRKSGYLDEALKLAGPIEKAQNWHQAIAIGLILRRKAQLKESELAFEKALEFTPEDISARLEAADTWFEYNQWQPALEWYKDVLKIDINHTWALPSSMYCQWKLTGEEKWIKDMIQMAREGNERAYRLWFEAYGSLPEPHDASANVLRQITESIEKTPENERSGGEIKLTLSALEAPSNNLAFRLEMEHLKCNNTLKVLVEHIPDPDPRNPSEPVKWLLWRYEGTDAFPALPIPSSEIVEAIKKLALLPYDPSANWAAASYVAARFGPDHCEEILAVSTYPPAVLEDSYALAWIPRIQLCVAQVLSQIDTGWDDSMRRQALLSMLFGPSDWTVSAAIRAMTWIARTETMYQLPIHDCFKRLEKVIPAGDGYCCWEEVLYEQWLNFPFLFDSERNEIKKKLEALNQN